MENYSLSDISAMMNGGNQGMNWNSPMWLIWAMLFGNGGFGGWGNRAGAVEANDINGRFNALSQQIADNQNTNSLGGAIGANHEQLHGINASINAASTANLMSQKDTSAQMASCCCQQKELTQRMGYEAQLRDQANNSAVLQRIDQLANGVQTGFSQVGFLTQQQTNELNNTINSGNQRIIDTLNNHWQSDLQQKYADAKLELSQLNQNATLIAALKTT